MFGRARLPGPGGLHLPIGRRSLLRATAILSSAGLLGAGGVPVSAAAVFDEMKPQWAAAKIDWMQQKGKKLVLGAERHPRTDAVAAVLPHFTRLTGIDVELQPLSETEYTAQLPVKLGAGSPVPDVYMVWAVGQAIQAGWLAPLDAMMADTKLLAPAWWDAADLFPSAREFQMWSDGKQCLMAITAESQILFMNRTMLDAKGVKVPATMDELLAAAKALKTDDAAGIALRAKSSGDSTWPVGGFIFSYGGAIIGLDGNVALDRPETVAGVDMYGRLLREAGPVGISSYQWTECLNDFMSGGLAMGCDSSNFATDIADPKKSTVAGHAALRCDAKGGRQAGQAEHVALDGRHQREVAEQGSGVPVPGLGQLEADLAADGGDRACDAARLRLAVKRVQGPVRRRRRGRGAGLAQGGRRGAVQGDVVPPERAADPRCARNRGQPERHQRERRRRRDGGSGAGRQAGARLRCRRSARRGGGGSALRRACRPPRASARASSR